MEFLYQFDLSIFNFVNQGLSNDVFDLVIPWFRNKYFWIPLYIFLIVYTILRYKTHAYIILLTSVVCVLFSDQVSSSFFKPTFERERPCNNIEISAEVNVLAPCRNSYSFVSSHASNHFTVAMFFSLVFGYLWKKKKLLLFFWAGLVSFAQIYVGLHYFFDVFVGGIIGLGIAWLMYIILNKYYLKYYKLS